MIHFNLLSLFILFCISHSQIPDDKASLLEFKSKITSDPKHAFLSWNSSDTHFCNWSNVVCNVNKTRVTELSLIHMSLTGTISPALFNLSQLLTLDLCGNFFTGTIPSEIGSLYELKYLSLPFNSLQGKIPIELGYLPRLTYVNLASNKLVGEIPVPLLCNTSTSLVYLELSENFLSGEIPMQNQCKARELKYLILWSNRLMGKLPLPLSNSSKLKWLDLGQNLFSGELPSKILSKLPCLNYIYLSSNHFSSHDNNTNLQPFFASLLNASKLKGIELSESYLGGELPSIVANITSLKEMSLDSNLIHGKIPPHLSNLANLTFLNLTDNLLNASIPSELCQMGKMERLYLSRNSLSGHIPLQVGNMQHLGLLDLSKNKLSGGIPDSFSNLVQLRKLLLYKNNLSGTIPPSLGKCVKLEILDLSHNRISGIIPSEVANLNSLKVYLNLSNNLLHGLIPSNLGKMDMVQAIDLSSNNLSSALTSHIGSCVALEFLNLSHNCLEGKFPESIGSLPYLKKLDVSFNQLTGEIPQSLQNSSTLKLINFSYNSFYGNIMFSSPTKNSFLGNERLCGSVEGLRKCHGNHTHRFLMSILLSLLITPIFCGVGCFLLCSSKRFLVSNDNKTKTVEVEDGEIYSGDELKELKYPRISRLQLFEATGDFSRSSLIGSGKFGDVYRGVLRDKDKTEIAVKVLHCKGEIMGSFKRECEVLRRIRHRNVIRIVSTCSRPDFKAIVLPLMKNGSLENHLYPRNGGKSGLNLVEVVRICSDVAEGVSYLHHYAPVKVVHCDLKPSNILQDEDMTAVVTDFGVSRLLRGGDGQSRELVSYESMNGGLVCGSDGYIAPEYGMGSEASSEGDVYSFGVVLMEMVMGKRPTDEMFRREGLSMHEWVKRRLCNEIVEEGMRRYGCDEETWDGVIREIVELGLICTEYDPGNRLTMRDVAREIGVLKGYLCSCSKK